MTVLEQALDNALRTFRDHYPGDTFTADGSEATGKITIQRNGEHFLTHFFPPGFIVRLETKYGRSEAPAFLSALIVDGRSED